MTPLIEKLPADPVPAKPIQFSGDSGFTDRRVAQSPSGVFGISIPLANDSFLYIRDQQPVMQGAAYQYYVVRLNNQHEISEVINTQGKCKFCCPTHEARIHIY